MSKMFSWSRLLLVGALVAVVPAAYAQEEGDHPLTLDEEYASLAGEVPGFGGLYLDEQGTTHVYLQDISHAREVQDLGERVEVHAGDYDFRDLFAWKEELRDRLAQPGAVFIDIDERRNRLVFGVERDALDTFSSELQTFLRRARVPSGAVIVEAAEPVVLTELLTDKIRPIPGGVQIATQPSGGVFGIGTLGVNATRLGVRGFVTNAHFTEEWGQVEGSIAFQNVPALNNLVGSEIADPPFFTGGSCPLGKMCRRSDSAFFDYVNDQTMSAGGVIAHPLYCAPLIGTVSVDPAFPRLPLTSFSFGTSAVGTFMTKVGRTTGCTAGPVYGTCMDVNPSGTNVTFLCQSRVLAGFDGGDSGSPVFRDYGTEATLYGIAWGSDPSTYFFSPWLSVHTELNGTSPELF